MNHGHSSHPKVTRDIQRERDPFRGGMIHCHNMCSHVNCESAGRHCMCIYVLGDGKHCTKVQCSSGKPVFASVYANSCSAV